MYEEKERGGEKESEKERAKRKPEGRERGRDIKAEWDFLWASEIMSLAKEYEDWGRRVLFRKILKVIHLVVHYVVPYFLFLLLILMKSSICAYRHLYFFFFFLAKIRSCVQLALFFT